jgi:Helix-turn-helix.
MNNKTVFQFSDYKSYLEDLEKHSSLKGFRSRIAEATGCQNAFVSQVLNGHVNFNLEQALKIAEFLNLKTDESQYFMWMVELKRAGTPDLKKYFQNLMKDLREKNVEIKDRVGIPQVLSTEAQTTYYSSWIYSAVHMGAMIGSMNSASKIAEGLQISESKAIEVVNFLITNGLLEGSTQKFHSGKIQIHLGKNTANITKHHTNWRIEAMKSLDNTENKTDLHYSGISCLSEEDAQNIKTLFVDMIANYVKIVEKSPEETLYTFNLDLFKVLK